jgi:hypothetical protein
MLFSTRIRQKMQLRFVELYSPIFHRMEWQAYHHKISDHMTDAGREVVAKARKHIGYSSTTASCDILRTLHNLYKLHKVSPTKEQIFQAVVDKPDIKNCKYYDRCKDGDRPYRHGHCCIDQLVKGHIENLPVK